MKEFSIDQTLAGIRELPDSLDYEEIAKMVVAVPVATATGFGIFKMTVKLLNIKYMIPIAFSTASASLAVWYAVQTFSPSPNGNSTSVNPVPEKKTPVVIQMNKDVPLASATIMADTTRKKVIKKEIQVVRKGQKGEMTPPPPLPPLPPLPPGSGKRQIIEREERVVVQGGEDEKEVGEKDPMNDPFISALVNYLTKEGLLKNKENFTIELTPTELEVNAVSANSEQLKKAIQLFEEKEKEKLGKGSEIEIRHKKGKWSVSKNIVN